MNILVIGNGFDIAHGLKTSYKDFLQFVKDFKEHDEAKRNGFEQGWSDNYDSTYISWIINLFNHNGNDDDRDFIVEFRILVQDNLWIEHFNEVSIKDGWVDFEKEISRIIQIIDEGRKTKKLQVDEKTGKLSSKIEKYAFQVIEPNSEDGAVEIGIDNLDDFKERLLTDLNKTIRALELYFSYYVEEEQLENDVEKLQVISSLPIDKVLSFNYTSTYKKLYASGRCIEYDYIHGRAKRGVGPGYNLNTCNMVLGIDEYLDERERNSDNEFIEFKKFYQRIFKKTGCQYKIWLETFNNDNDLKALANREDINIYFYGHSLDVTDKDVISELIRQPRAKTTIFYHNRKALGERIANLVKVITEEELIRRTGGNNPSIIFKTLDGNDEFELANNHIMIK